MQTITLVGKAKDMKALPRYVDGTGYTVTVLGETIAVLEGEDVAGWTLDGYILPRLAQWGIVPAVAFRL